MEISPFIKFPNNRFILLVVCIFILVNVLRLPTLAWAAPPGFPESIPMISKKEYKALGLKQTYNSYLSANGNHSFYNPYDNCSYLVQDFTCKNCNPDTDGVIRLFTTYYPDNRGIDLFNYYSNKQLKSLKDSEEKYYDDDGSLGQIDITKYEIHPGKQISWRHQVITHKYFNSDGSKANEWSSIDLEYEVITGKKKHYSVSLEAEYCTTRSHKWDTEKLAVKLLNLYLKKIPDNDVFIKKVKNPSSDSEKKHKKKKQKLHIKIAPTNLVANGKEQKLIFQLSMPDGTPASNKIYRVIYSHESFKKDGKTVDYLTRPIITYYLKTNSEGRGVLFIPTPRIKKAMLNNIRNPDAKFPVQAKFNIFDGADLVGSFTINFQSPFPKIKKFLLPCGMDAENWQIRPSKVFIEDLDSNEFNIEIFGYGRFKVRGGKIYNTLLRVRNFKGKVFEFYLASKELGLDLNKQPDMWRELLETNLKVAASVLITYSSGKVLSDVRNTLQKGNKLEKILSANGKIKSEDVAAVAQNYFGTSDYYNNTLSFIHDKNKNYVKTQDMVVGGVFLTSGIYDLFKKASTGLGPAMQMELMKAIYENAKTVYGVYSKYRKIADSYRDIIFIPIFVKVTDKEGYSVITAKKCGVRVWKGVE